VQSLGFEPRWLFEIMVGSVHQSRFFSDFFYSFPADHQFIALHWWCVTTLQMYSSPDGQHMINSLIMARASASLTWSLPACRVMKLKWECNVKVFMQIAVRAVFSSYTSNVYSSFLPTLCEVPVLIQFAKLCWRESHKKEMYFEDLRSRGPGSIPGTARFF
jgi:hypothetical protein